MKTIDIHTYGWSIKLTYVHKFYQRLRYELILVSSYPIHET